MEIMKQEDKELLLRDLVARIPYGVVVNCTDGDVQLISVDFEMGYDNPEFWHDGPGSNINFNDDNIKPYLFPLSSMTEEQDKEFALLQTSAGQEGFLYIWNCANMMKWLIENHFDYNGLIPKGLAIDATSKNIY